MKRTWFLLALGLSLAVNAGVVGAVVRERVRIGRIDRKLAAQLKDNSRRGLKQFMTSFDDYFQARKPVFAAIDSAYRDLGRLGLQPDADSAAVEQVLYRLDMLLQRKWTVEMRMSREHWALYRPEVAARIKARIRVMEKEGRRLAGDDSMPAEKEGR